MITQFKIFEARAPMDKINFEWESPDGKIFKFKNITVYKEHSYVPMMGVSQVIRQYIKQRWNIPFQISTDSFSGGDSVRVYVSPLNVTDKNIFEDINIELKVIFQAGNFDGSTDSYEYKKSSFKISANGKEYSFRTKYLFVEYEPKYGTKQYDEYREWKEMNDEAEKFNI